MAQASGIEWTDATWNPVRGCSRVSQGCVNCYAERIAARFSWPGQPFHGFTGRADPHWTGRVELIPEKLAEPLRWRKPQRIFVNSMSDLFHERLSYDAITAVYGVMAAAPHHTFQVLTKRPARRKAWCEWLMSKGGLGPFIRSGVGRSTIRPYFDNANCTRTEVINGRTVRSAKDAWMMVMNAAACVGHGPLFNVQEGTSIEDQPTADERIPPLLETPATVRFLSAEPLLGPIDLKPRSRPDLCIRCGEGPGAPHNHPDGYRTRGLDWVIVGGESGPGARPCEIAWIRSVVAQCKTAGLPCFVKQLGARPVCPVVPDGLHGHALFEAQCAIDDEWPTGTRFWNPTGDHPLNGRVARLRNSKGADPLEWPEDLRVREIVRLNL